MWYRLSWFDHDGQIRGQMYISSERIVFVKIYHANEDVRTSDLSQYKYDNEADIQQHLLKYGCKFILYKLFPLLLKIPFLSI